MAFDFNKLKGLFIVQDPEVPKVENTENTKNEAPSKNSTKKEITQPNISLPAAVDDKIRDTLLQALADNNMEGFDYFEFKQSLATLSKMPLDEATQFKSAFATAATMGITKENLLQSADYYKKVLHKEKEKFDVAVKGQNNANVLKKKEELETLKKVILEKSAQIKRLTDEITSHNEQIEQGNKFVNEAEGKILGTVNNFEASFNSVNGAIEIDIEKIKKHL
ncbi:MAG: hypothetical protein IPN93_05245 [Bacteroidetes bacterium]|nr:hypothetical protein [Bacteroidota bacterium]MBL0287036.1 hypothetical protein [Bacteroidota bacterium]MBP9136321.1 hypothetical protein [Chitinophagales bacterium]